MLSVEHVSKGFAGVQALDDVNVEIGVNEVVGLVGENGAGQVDPDANSGWRLFAGPWIAETGRRARFYSEAPGTLIFMASGSSSRSSRCCSI